MTKISALDTAEITIRRARFARYVKSVMLGCGVICLAAGARAALASSHNDPAPKAAPAAAVAVANVTTSTSDELGTPTAHKRDVADGVAPDAYQLATGALKDAARPHAPARSTIAAKRPGRH
jgi:hypothetical protein